MSEALCQVCGEAVVDEKVYCSRCHAPHHRDCWEFNKGCSIFGCGGVDCLKVPIASDSAGEVVYIEESTVPPMLPVPEASRKRASLWHDSRMIWVATLVAVLSLSTFEPKEPNEPSRPRISRQTKVRRLSLPARPLFEAVLKRDVSDAAGRVDIPAGTKVQVFWPDSDRRYRIRAEGRPDRWVAADAFERVKTVSTEQASSLKLTGLGQLVKDLPGLPRGQFVLLSRLVPVSSEVTGLKIRAFGQQAWTEQQRYVLLGPNDFQRVSGQGRGVEPSALVSLTRSMWKAPSDGKPTYAVVIERTPTRTGMLEPGTFLRVTQLESVERQGSGVGGQGSAGGGEPPAGASGSRGGAPGFKDDGAAREAGEPPAGASGSRGGAPGFKDDGAAREAGEPAYVLGENASGQYRVPASACRPVLASRLRAEARRLLPPR